jgi:FSR family fosmidomycin resistance protein-like MFS transporter
MVFEVTASLLQPAIGWLTDRRPMFRLLAAGMGFSLAGLLVLAFASGYLVLLLAAMCIGLGSSIFHPGASRLARSASGGRYGMAQSVFQVGGNTGSAMGPLLAAYVVLPLGQPAVAWFSALALLGMVVLWRVGTWAKEQHFRKVAGGALAAGPGGRRVAGIITILALLIFSKYIYVTSLTGFYTFYLIERFGVSVRDSQLLLFLFLGAIAAGTFAGGPIGDRIGRNAVIRWSILGVLPFTLILPHANLFWTAALSVVIGLIIASAFSAIIVYAQALLPGRVGLVSGLFFGFAFGIAGIGAAALGALADWKSITFVFQICAFLPAIGLLAWLLPPERGLARG